MAGPQEFSRRANRDTDTRSAKEDALDALSEWIPKQLPFGSVALLRVDPSEHRGQDIVPVIVARKAACPWTPAYAADGMFGHGDTIVWVVDLPQVPEHRQRVEYVVPRSVSGVKFRAVPLTCIAGLGQGLMGYMELSPYSVGNESSGEHFVMRNGVIEDARSAVVTLSTRPAAAFKDFQPVPFSTEDFGRAKVEPKMFEIGTVVEESFKGPRRENGRLLWKKKKTFTGVVTACRTLRESRRHEYFIEWAGDTISLVLAGVQAKVDEGYIEQYSIRNT